MIIHYIYNIKNVGREKPGYFIHEATIKMTNLDWNYESNITDETEAIKLEYKVNLDISR